MLFVKIVIYSGIFVSSSLIGILISKKYTNRVNELNEFKTAFNIFKTKIRYTYETLPEIFEQISESINYEIGKVFKIASQNMSRLTAGESWNLAVEMNMLNIEKEDKEVLKNISKLLGKTDLKGQIDEIDLTLTFLDSQIKTAEREKLKNEKLYRTLGMLLGMAMVIILM